MYIIDNGKEQLRKAMLNNFAIPENHERKKRLIKDYIILQKKLPNLEKRTKESEQLRDFFAYIGGAAIVGLIAFLIEKKL